ncbi:MAG: elongation factor G [Dehalococcoidia bacterium]|nr:elongation factor G [Dehalococcoidia bacterium]
MERFTTGRIRNVALLGHSGSGKTTLVESMLFAAKAINRQGRVEDGNTVSDFEPEEHRRGTSLQLSVVPCVWQGTKVNLVDTPGYADFAGEQASALRAVDAAVLVVSAPAGVEVGTELAWQRLREAGTPTMVFVNKMDRDGADFEAALGQARSALGRGCVPINFPIGAAAAFSGIAGVLKGDAPGDMEAALSEAKEQLTEAVAETEDQLTERYLEEGDLPLEDIERGLRRGILDRQIAPVLAGSAITGAGVADLIEAIIDYLPSPDRAGERAASVGGEEISLPANPDGPLAASIFKTAADPFVGKASYFRVLSGTMRPNQEVFNSTRNESERVGQILVPVGKVQESVPDLAAGDIGVVTKLAHAVTGDTLTTRTDGVQAPPLEFPEAVYSVGVHPKSQADLDKMSSALSRLGEEDPSLVMRRNGETGELVVLGMGDTHVDVMAERAKRKFGVELDMRVPQVPYRETISKTTNTEYKHKKQTGGHGQYGHVLIRLEPRERGAGFEFGAQVVGGNVPKEYIPAVEKGVVKAMQEGADGFPMVDMRVVLYDGSSHSVDSSGASFEIAGSMALKQGVRAAAPVLLEPIMRLQLTVPESAAGAVVGDLNGRRARINGMTPQGGVAVIEAEAPQAEVQQWATSLRALTQGRGTMRLEFDHFGEVPSHLTQKIMEATAAR